MGRTIVFAVAILATPLIQGRPPTPGGPEAVVVRHGDVVLHALLWRPQGHGPYPGILFNHGSGRSAVDLGRLGPYEDQAPVIGQVFARHGYAFLYLFRQGVGLSADQGPSCIDLMDREMAEHGQDARNRLQMDLLTGREMADAQAGLAFLRAAKDIDPRQLAVIGHSFGGSLTVMQAEREPNLRAAVVFATAGFSWDNSEALRTALTHAVARAAAPLYFIHAANDFSIAPGQALDAARARARKPHKLTIYPAFGQTIEDGHGFLYLDVKTWEPDVFSFLAQYLRTR
jgi:dienelactone hydrolase